MFDNSVSMFRCVSIGTAAENKVLGSNELTITPHEKLTFMDGETVEKVDALDYEGATSTGKAVNGTAFVSNNLVAKWLPSSNRKTPPDMRRGEKVRIWQMANQDAYYWTDLGLDGHLRRLETVIIAINANPALTQDEFDPENMYFMEISSHQKTITLSTSQKNGEFCTYDFQFDLANGKVVLEDNKGNHALFDTQNINIQLKNQLGTFFELNKQDINGYAPRNILLEATNNVDVKAKKITLNGGGSVFTLQGSGTSLVTPTFKGSS